MPNNSNEHYDIPTHGNLLNKKIVFITAIYGDYESSCKPYVQQTILTDFVCFTNNNNIVSNNWSVDSHPYHKENPSTLDDGSYLNSLKNNNHTFNIAKYYKQSFHNIPRLKNYDVVVWLDGTKEITHPKAAEWIVNQIELNPIITWEHLFRKGSLRAEVDGSMQGQKYISKFWLNQKQPYQDVQAQYQAYIQDGYDENLWVTIAPQRKNFGVWNTGFIAFNNSNTIHKFLDLWYLQTLKYSTQDQVGFSYVVQKLHLYPHTLPDLSIRGNSDGNYLFVKHYHNDQQTDLDNPADLIGHTEDPSHIALYYAAITNNTEIIEELLEARTEVKLKAYHSLHAALKMGHYQISKTLLQYGVEINLKHAGGTLLYWAAQDGKFENAELLLKAGANLEIKAINNMTPLTASVQNNYLNITKLFIEAGADIEEPNGLGATPLYLAAYFGYNSILQLLLDNGANKNIQVNGISAFQRALQNEHVSAAKLIAGGKEELCQQIQGTVFEVKYVEICGARNIESQVES